MPVANIPRWTSGSPGSRPERQRASALPPSVRSSWLRHARTLNFCLPARPLGDERNLRAAMGFLDKEHQRALFVFQNAQGQLIATPSPAEHMAAQRTSKAQAIPPPTTQDNSVPQQLASADLSASMTSGDVGFIIMHHVFTLKICYFSPASRLETIWGDASPKCFLSFLRRTHNTRHVETAVVGARMLRSARPNCKMQRCSMAPSSRTTNASYSASAPWCGRSVDIISSFQCIS